MKAIRAFLFCLAAGCGAAHAERTEVYAGLALLDFGNKAYFDDEFIYREDGLLPGLAVEVARRIGDWRLTADGRLFSGSTDFHTVPFEQQGESDERMYSLSLRIARELRIDGWSVAPYAGYGYHRRQREGEGELGTVSVYTWKTAELGAFVKVPARGRFEGGIDLRVFRVLDPEMRSDFGGFFDGEVRIGLGEHSGARFGLVGTYLLEAGLRVRVDLYHERWSFGQGEQVMGTASTGTIIIAGEPRSEFRNTGVTLGLLFGF